MIRLPSDASPTHESNQTESFQPLVEELTPGVDACQAFLGLSGLPHCLFLDSARREPVLGRYSFVAADPFDYFEAPADGADALSVFERGMAGFAAETISGLPPFQGGAAGLFSYDLCRGLERLPRPAIDEFQAPALAVGFYDVVIAFDHVEQRGWIVSQGWPETQPDRRRRRAEQRLRFFQDQLSSSTGRPLAKLPPSAGAIRATDLAEQYPVGKISDLTSNTSRREYLHRAKRAIGYIHAGDVFQVNLAHRLLHPARDDSVSLYMRLRERNPATFSAYFDLGAFQIVSASPERFLKVRDRNVEARPIKGTRRRTAQAEADLFAGDELQQSQKDRAENVMIVDLWRNDLSRVCRPESVHVSQLCRLETYEYVQHLVSAVAGRLSDDCSLVELLRRTFPGGSVTGAPKVRAMEIIAELEPTARGAYCGSLGYLGFDGSMDTSILIRTITAGRGWWQAPVGGGIVAQSSPEREYEETWHKAEGLIRAFE
jgi:para-aminobenzoate synthetase component 1